MEFGCEPAIGIKQTFRMGVRDPLSKLSLENWGRYRRERYRVEGVFGLMKQKLGSSIRAIREDMSMKMALACALLWNFYVLVAWFYFFALSVSFRKVVNRKTIRFLEQPPVLLDTHMN